MLNPLVRIWVYLRVLHPCLRNRWLRTPKVKTLFVFIALVVRHLRAMISSFGRVHILPQLDGTSCA